MSTTPASPQSEPAPPGRSTAPARFLVLYRTPSDVEAFERHYHDVHLPLARRLPGLRRYLVSQDISPVRGGEPYYLVAELEWDDIDTLRAAFASPEGRATAADMSHLTGLSNVTSFTYQTRDVL